MKNVHHSLLHMTSAATLMLAVSGALAQSYPARPVRMIIPYAPGGIVDYVGRLSGPRLADELGQNVVIDNRPGGGGVIAVETTVRALADGHTLLLSDPAIVVNPTLLPKAPFDVARDLAAVTVFSTASLVLSINSKTPAKSVQELVALAAKSKLSYGSAGVGSMPHMAGELFKNAGRLDIVHVPYKGIGPAVTDLIGGQVQIVFGSVAGVLPFIKDGRLRGLASTGEKRTAAMPGVPTMIESGFPGFEVSIWLTVFVPAGTPKAVIARLNADLRKVLQNAEVRSGLDRSAIEPLGTSAEQADQFVRRESAKWAALIKAANIKSN